MSSESRTRSSGPGRRFQKRYLLLIPLILMTIFYLIPLYVLLVTGFKSFEEVSLQTMWNLPSGFHLDNYLEAFDKSETTSVEQFDYGHPSGHNLIHYWID